MRHEAWRLASIRHAAHLRRRLDDAGTDAELLAAGLLPGDESLYRRADGSWAGHGTQDDTP